MINENLQKMSEFYNTSSNLDW